MAVYRILSLDGGGIRGLLSAALMEGLEKRKPGWLDRIDLVAGTSTGGILALGLAKGMSPSELVELYYELGPKIFKDNLFDNIKDLGGLTGAQYGTKHLRRELNGAFGQTRLQDLKKRVLITSFDLDNEASSQSERSWKPKFFHNFPGNDSDGSRRAADVALYTSAAPTFFPSVDGFIDGGVVANHPGMAAVAQTQDRRCRIAPRPKVDEIRLFSIGTGQNLSMVKGRNLDWGIGQWAKPLLHLMLDALSGVPDYQCRQMLGKNYHRINHTFTAGAEIRMDDWKQRDRLLQIARERMAGDLATAARWLGTHW